MRLQDVAEVRDTFEEPTSHYRIDLGPANHSVWAYINVPRYNRTSNPYGNGCVNCHIMTHGSNHPSGAKQTR